MAKRRTLNIPEAAELLGISRGLAYELARRDELPVPVLCLGRRRVVSRAALNAALLAGADSTQNRKETAEVDDDPESGGQ